MNVLDDENWFKKMNIKTSYSILSDLGFKGDELKNAYNKTMFENL